MQHCLGLSGDRDEATFAAYLGDDHNDVHIASLAPTTRSRDREGLRHPLFDDPFANRQSSTGAGSKERSASFNGGEGGADLLFDDLFADFEWGEAGHDAVHDQLFDLGRVEIERGGDSEQFR